MAYTKNTWVTGDIVSSAKLNHMEDGIANSENVFIVGGVQLDAEGPYGTLDKTWQEIYDAMQSKVVIAPYVSDNEIIQFRIDLIRYDDSANAYVVPLGNVSVFTTASRDGYPSLSGGTDPIS